MGAVTKHRRTSIDDLVLDHLISRSSRLFFVNPVRLEPVIMRDQSKVNRCVRQDADPSVPYTSANEQGEGVNKWQGKGSKKHAKKKSLTT